MSFKLFDFIYYKIENIRYRLSRNRVYKYRHVNSINSVLRGYNTLFEGVSIWNCEIGEYTYIQKHTNLINTKIGRFCSIADHVRTGFGNHPIDKITTFPAFYYNTKPELGFTFYSGEPRINIFRKTGGGKFLVEIGNDVWIGAHVLIMDGVTIGDGAVIAAGAIVTKDIEPYSVYGGVPAKLIKYRFGQEKINALLDIKWWNKDMEWIQSSLNNNLDIDDFIKNYNKDI